MGDKRWERTALTRGWYYPDDAEAERLSTELQRELPPGHRLFGLRVRVTAACQGNDDVLVRHLNAPERFTIVHLTWRGETELGPEYPSIEFDGDYGGFIQYEEGYDQSP